MVEYQPQQDLTDAARRRPEGELKIRSHGQLNGHGAPPAVPQVLHIQKPQPQTQRLTQPSLAQPRGLSPQPSALNPGPL